MKPCPRALLAAMLAAVAVSCRSQPLPFTSLPALPRGGMHFLYQPPLVANGHLYVIRDRVFEYDPERNNWAQFMPRPTVHRWHHASAASGGRLYVIGGSAKGEPREWVDAVEEFDPATARWRLRAALPGARRNAGAVTLGRSILVIGGEGAGPGAMPVVSYDPGADRWTACRAVSRLRHCWGAQVLNGKVYALGTSGPREGPELRFEEYDPSHDEVRTLAPPPRPRMAFALVAVNGRIAVLGGSPGENVPLAQVDLYDPATDTWSARPPLPDARCWLGAASLGPRVYVIGGVAGDFSRASGAMYAIDADVLAPSVPAR